MTVVPFVVAVALVSVAGAATAYAAVDRSRAASALVAAAVLATTEVPRVPSLAATSAIRPDEAAAVALGALATVMIFGVRRWAVVGVGLGAAMRLAGPLLLTDPFLDPTCRLRCGQNPWAMTNAPTASVWVAAAGVALETVSILAMVVSDRRRPLAAGAGAVVAVLTVTTSASSLVDPGAHTMVAASLMGACGLVVLAAEVVAAVRQRDRLRLVVDQLVQAEHPEAAFDGSPAIRLEYFLEDEDVWVDAHGVRVPPHPPGPGPAPAVQLRGPEGVIARVVNPGSPSAVTQWSRRLRGPSRLALDNARRAAECAFEAREIVESSRRLVTRADDERRRIERDLHDRAQQHVLALGLRLALHQEDVGPGDPTWPALERGRTKVREVLADLRDIAHGIHTTALDEPGGLAHAVELLANRSLVPVEPRLLVDAPDRTSAVTAYALVEEVVASATGPVVVETADGDGFVVSVHVGADGPGRLPSRSHDRFRALGGALVVEPGQPDGFVVRGRLPSPASLPALSNTP
jgi:signal transduction histidine kinase